MAQLEYKLLIRRKKLFFSHCSNGLWTGTTTMTKGFPDSRIPIRSRMSMPFPDTPRCLSARKTNFRLNWNPIASNCRRKECMMPWHMRRCFSGKLRQWQRKLLCSAPWQSILTSTEGLCRWRRNIWPGIYLQNGVEKPGRRHCSRRAPSVRSEHKRGYAEKSADISGRKDRCHRL